MSNVLVLYATASGNTEILAEAMASYLKKKDHHVTIKNFDFDNITAQEIKEYDATFLGIYTYDFGEIPFETEYFYDELDKVDLTGSIGCVFGDGDRYYGDTFGLAVDIFHDKLTERGAILDPERLKIDLTPSQKDIEQCEQMADRVLAMIEKGK